MKKLLLLVAAFALFLNGICYATCCPSYALPYPATYETCRNIYFTTEFLYWKMHEDGLSYVVNNFNTSPGATPLPSPGSREPNWVYKPGFRFILGKILDCDSWDLSLTYTWYRSRAFDSFSSGSPDLRFFGTFATVVVDRGQADFLLTYHTLDLTLKKPFFVGEKVILAPSFGLFAGFTHEDYNMSVHQVASIDIINDSLSQRLRGVGPKAALSTTWLLTPCFSIFGEASIAFLWSDYLVQREETGGGSIVPSAMENRFDTTRLVPAYSMGIHWNRPICQERYLVNLKAQWEQTVWLQHNQFFLLNVTNDNTILFNNTNLSLYGLTLSAGIQF